jgi:hypothetical protein
MINMKSKLDPIEQKVMDALHDLFETCELPDSDSKGWTRSIKEAVGKVGESLGYEVWAAESQYERRGEWVFDLGWFQMDSTTVLSVPLAMESEWTLSGVLEDFQKLLISRAMHRVMMFEVLTQERWEETVDLLLSQVAKYSETRHGDRYLLCCWVESAEQLNFLHYVAGEAA